MPWLRNALLIAFGVAIGALLPTVSAQAPVVSPPAAVAPAPPPLDELGQAWVETLRYAQARAQDACAQLPQTKDYDAKRQNTFVKIEARWPGYTLDVSKGALVKK